MRLLSRQCMSKPSPSSPSGSSDPHCDHNKEHQKRKSHCQQIRNADCNSRQQRIKICDDINCSQQRYHAQHDSQNLRTGKFRPPGSTIAVWLKHIMNSSHFNRLLSCQVYGAALQKPELPAQCYSRKQRARRTCLHVRLAVLCTGGTRLTPIERSADLPGF